ncbi:MAG: hypothetical protein MI919_14375, partial [Holophagales bacterium]|nr:hypothetical protein [Holophagales bacterium]
MKRDQGMLELLEGRRSELGDLRARLERTGRIGDPLYTAPLEAVDACSSVLDGLELGLLEGKTVGPNDAERCMSDVRSRFSAADTTYVLHRQLIPTVVRGGAALLLLGSLAFLFFRRRTAAARAREEIERWQAKLGNAAERLLELEGHHPLYFAPDGRRWQGDSRELDQACADAVNRVYLLYAQATQLLDRAELLVGGGGWWRAGPYRQAWKLLRETEITFDTGAPAEGEDHRRIFLPLTVEYRGTALQLLDDLDASYGAAIERLDEVAALDARNRDLIEQVEQVAERALWACGERADLGMPTGEATAALDPLLAEKKRARLELSDDPVAAVRLLEGLLGELQDWADRLARGNEALTELRGPVTELGEALRRRIGELRDDGFRLEEPGFRPDLRLDRGAGQADRVEQAVAEGREDDARAELDSLFEGLAELEEQLDAIATAREGIPGDLRALAAEVSDLRSLLPGARATLETLHREHSTEAFPAEADNLDELDELLG